VKPQFINVAVAVAVAVVISTCSAFADDKIDVSKVITKSDAERILGVPVKDAKGRNQNGTQGYYDSEWSY
jgi:capsular polysaccharide biosynthesis protein